MFIQSDTVRFRNNVPDKKVSNGVVGDRYPFRVNLQIPGTAFHPPYLVRGGGKLAVGVEIVVTGEECVGTAGYLIQKRFH